MVTITYDSKQTSPLKLAEIIRSLDYGAHEVPVERGPADTAGPGGFEPFAAPLPEGAPKAFAESFRAAREAGKPIILDFWATWCPPCAKLKKHTLEDPTVARALEGVSIIFVDLDQHPTLAKAYGVTSIPDVFFVDRSGNVTDRLMGFEEPAPFLERINKWMARMEQDSASHLASLGLSTSVPSDEVVKDLGLTHNVRVLGRLVDSVEAGGPAAAAGLLPGDVLLGLGHNDLYSADDIADFLAVSAPGDRIALRFKRAGTADVRQVSVVLGSRASTRGAHDMHWQYAGLGQLPAALEEARAKKKKVMVGLSGAES